MQKNQKIQKILLERHKPATFSDEEICEIDDVIENMTDLHEYGISNWYPSIEDINTRILNKKKIEKQDLAYLMYLQNPPFKLNDEQKQTQRYISKIMYQLTEQVR